MPSDRRGTALIVGKFAPPHKGHQYLIETALRDQNVDEWIILVYSNPDFLPTMPSHRRAAWLRHLYPRAKIFVPDNPPPNDADDFTQREFVKQWLEQNNINANVVYTSETYGEGFAQHASRSSQAAHRGLLHFSQSGCHCCTRPLEPGN